MRRPVTIVERAANIRRKSAWRLVEKKTSSDRGLGGVVVRKGRQVVYDAEHFFDGIAQQPLRADTIKAAADGGWANGYGVVRTNGGSIGREFVEEAPAQAKRVSVIRHDRLHTHDDRPSQSPNALAAIERARNHAQGTINGSSASEEMRQHGHPSRSSPTCSSKYGYDCLRHGTLQHMTEDSRATYTIWRT